MEQIRVLLYNNKQYDAAEVADRLINPYLVAIGFKIGYLHRQNETFGICPSGVHTGLDGVYFTTEGGSHSFAKFAKKKGIDLEQITSRTFLLRNLSSRRNKTPKTK